MLRAVADYLDERPDLAVRSIRFAIDDEWFVKQFLAGQEYRPRLARSTRATAVMELEEPPEIE